MHTTKTREFEHEKNIIAQLQALGYEYRPDIKKINALMENVRAQINALHKITMSNKQWEEICDALRDIKDNIHAAKLLRETLVTIKDDDGMLIHIKLLHTDWCKNKFQVIHQYSTKEGERYDITLLINGIPLVLIELKKLNGNIKEAFQQLDRYRKNFDTLHTFMQVLCVSNITETRYFAHNAQLNPDFTFQWTDKDNKRVDADGKGITGFIDTFLDPCFLARYIHRYMLIMTEEKKLIALRPYQVYAIDAIMKHYHDNLESPMGNAYVWHTTGSGKTITSFMAARNLIALPAVDKVVFVVDRIDLDKKTVSDFASYSDAEEETNYKTHNTRDLIQKLVNDKSLIIITTLQKLNRALNREKDAHTLETAAAKRTIFIFDECHRSTFGTAFLLIKKKWHNPLMFGFTGTPIFSENARQLSHTEVGQGWCSTTQELFPHCLHSYKIDNAIQDENVLPFAITYYNSFDGMSAYQEKSSTRHCMVDKNPLDIPDTSVFKDSKRMREVAKIIMEIHNKNPGHTVKFTAFFAVNSIQDAIDYYEFLQSFNISSTVKDKRFDIGMIFSISNDAEHASHSEMNDAFESDSSDIVSIQDKFICYLDAYNTRYNTAYTIANFSEYRADIMSRIQRVEIDIVIVVDMLLTGFDAQRLNTLYVDKNVRYHTLIQAFSRTNRVFNKNTKSTGRIICFRNLERNIDEALMMYASSYDGVIVESKEVMVQKLQQQSAELQHIAPLPSDIEHANPEDKVSFVKAMRPLLQTNNVLNNAYPESDTEILSCMPGDTTDEQEKFYFEYIRQYKQIAEAQQERRKIEKQERHEQGHTTHMPTAVEQLEEFDFNESVFAGTQIIDFMYIMQLIQKVYVSAHQDNNNSSQEELLDKVKPYMGVLSSEIKKVVREFILEHREHMIHCTVTQLYNEIRAFIGEYEMKRVREILENIEHNNKRISQEQIQEALEYFTHSRGYIQENNLTNDTIRTFNNIIKSALGLRFREYKPIKTVFFAEFETIISHYNEIYKQIELYNKREGIRDEQ